MKKRLFVMLMAAVLLVSTAGCTSGESNSASESSTPSISTSETKSTPDISSEVEPTPTPESVTVDLAGDWEQTNKNSDTNYQIATITENTIEVYWMDSSTDTKSLYWAGTVSIPDGAGTTFSWDSENDTEKTSNALLASGDETKTFSYDNGQLSYDVTAMGITQTVKLEKMQEKKNQEEVSQSAVEAHTSEQSAALSKAFDYLEFSSFSYSGLVDQLEYEGFSTEDASWAADNCGADWNEQALQSAKNYLDYTAFSYTGLIGQLEYEGFTTDQATYGADNCGADWMEQAALCAQNYLDFTSFSREGLIDQLLYEGFTQEQAEHGAAQVGM